MDPMNFTNSNRPPVFGQASSMKNKVEFFDTSGEYQDWMEKHNDVKIISVISHRDRIVLTYMEAL